LKILALLFVVLWTAPVLAQSPHWAAVKTPYEAGRYNLRIDVPLGFQLCSIANSYSSLLSYFVLLDPRERCESLRMNATWDEMPDFVVIAPYTDVALNIDTLDDYVKNDTHFCLATRAASKNGDIPASNAPVTMASVGKILMGFDAVACAREDIAADRYTKALLAYRPATEANGDDFMGHGVTVGTYVHMKNKQAADKLLDDIARLMRRLK
jgi:hypothetical protein